MVDPDLASAIKGLARRKHALQAVTAAPLQLSPGEHLNQDSIGSEETLGLVVLSGFLVREWTTAESVSADLLGPEDVVHPWGGEPMITMLHHTVSWTAITPTRLALLDEQFFHRAVPWPEITGTLLERSGRLAQRLALRGAIESLNVDARVLASFWLWASQWATVAGQGVVLRIPLSHERIARLIHARRPTVTTAIGRLRRAGLINQRQDGVWLLRGLDAHSNGQGEEGVAMPALGEMLERRLERTRDEMMTAKDSRALAMRELRERLEEQRATLQAAAKRHHEMLERMRAESGRLASATGVISRR